VGPGIDVLDGVHVPQGEGVVSGIFRHLHRQNDVLFAEKCIRLVHEKLIFPYGRDIVGNVILLAF